jgi:hypothetical protein
VDTSTRVVINESITGLSHHVLAHARRQDVGVVVEAQGAEARVPGSFVLVEFEGCPTRHRLLVHELEPVDEV